MIAASMNMRGFVVVGMLWLAACGDDDGGSEADGGPDSGGQEEGGTFDCTEGIGPSDRDGDGFEACDDCDDRDPRVSPGENEGFCCSTNLDDHRDNDCDGEVDERPPLSGCQCADEDPDGDGYLDRFDCEPDDPAVNPGVPEGQGCSPGRNDDKDNDCDGDVDEVEVPCDFDGDGYPEADDCDDLVWWISPGRTESCCSCDDGAFDARAAECDSLDNDCDGDVDESPFCDCDQPDADYDGYRDGDDCDDDDPNTNPGVMECCCEDYGGWWCNETDDDCDGTVDEDTAPCCQFGGGGD